MSARKAYVFFSVHERLFHPVAQGLREHGIEQLAGFVWSKHQAQYLADGGYDPLVVFTRDLLPKCDEPPDVAWLERREAELGVSFQRVIASERHLLAGRTHEQILRLLEVALREVAAAYDRFQPDFVFSEDVSCLHSYVHMLLAKERGIRFWAIGSGRLARRINVYSEGFMRSERVERTYHEIMKRGLTADERRDAEAFVQAFRDRPARPTGMDTRAKKIGLERQDAGKFFAAFSRYAVDPDDPTGTHPALVIRNRVRKIIRVRAADAAGVFEKPVPGEKYVLYPLHLQPEASTLVQGPLFLDQLALLRDMAMSLPVGHRLYVKEHLSNRGRRPVSFYQQIRAIPSVRLLGPDENTWELIRNAGAITVISGTMGWEGLLYDKPVVVFGEVFYDLLPHVYHAKKVPKDGWYEMFTRATTAHRSDREAVLAFVTALHHASYPGFIANPNGFPEVLAPENIESIRTALVSELGLSRAKTRRPTEDS